MLSKPEGWSYNPKGDIIKRATDGQESLYSGIKELVKAGYVSRIKHSNGGIDYYIFEDKRDNQVVDYSANTENHDQGNPDQQNPDQQNPDVLVILNTSNTEGSNTKDNKTLTQKLQTDQFLQFWSVYPKKQDRAKALRAWLKIKMNTDLYQTILTALETQKKGIQWQKNGGQFIPLATTWLNGQRWTDEVINYKQGDKPMTETQRRQASFEAATRGARQQDRGEFFEAQFNEVGAK